MQYGFDNNSKIITKYNNDTPYVCSINNKKMDGMQYNFYSGILNQPASKIDNPKEPINYCVERKEREIKHEETRIIRIRPQRGESICTPASFIIAILILNDYKILYNDDIINILHYDESKDEKNVIKSIVHEMISDFTKNPDRGAYDIEDLKDKITALAQSNNFFSNISNGDEYTVGIEPAIYHENFFSSQIRHILSDVMPINSVMSFIYGGVGIAFVRFNDKYVYIDTHGYTGGGYIIMTTTIDGLLSNMNLLISTYKAQYTSVYDDYDLDKVYDQKEHYALQQTQRYIMAQYNYSIFTLKQSEQRGGYITKKQDWFKIKYM